MKRPMRLLLAVTALVCLGYAQPQGARPLRLVVKLRAPLSDAFVREGASSPRIQAFLQRHRAASARPLYPGLVAARRRTGLSDRQLALQVRGRFAARAGRLRAAFNPPELSRTYVLEVSQSSAAATLSALKADPEVEYAEQDHLVSAVYTPNDPYLGTSGAWGQSFRDLWGLQKLNAEAAWDTSTGEGVLVAVVDTGLDMRHPDIADNVWTNSREIPGNGIDDDGNGFIDDAHGWNFVSATNDPTDDHGHGTHVSGTIAAVGDNGIGIVGVAWRSKVMPVKVLNAGGSGMESDCAAGIVYAADQGADVLNLSWGRQGESTPLMDEAIHYAYSMGAVVVSAAGNSGADVKWFTPASLWETITVSALGPDGNLASFSNWGGRVDVAAPGVDVLSLRAAGTGMGLTLDDNYTRASGTSMAAPHIAGVAALILSRYPDASNEEVRQILRVSASQLPADPAGRQYGYGAVDSAAALTIDGALEAKITGLAYGSTFASPVVIYGVARGQTFARYTLEYGAGTTPADWTVISAGDSSVTGQIGTFDPDLAPNGDCILRLTAYNLAGQAFVDRIQIRAAAVSLTSPAPPTQLSSSRTFKPGVVVPIEGVTGGAAFKSFRLEWARGETPDSGWETGGMTLAADGALPVAGGALGAWDTSGITEADYYTIRLTVDKTTFVTQASTLVYLEPGLVSADWPRLVSRGPAPEGGMLPVRMPDGSTELLLAGSNWAMSEGRNLLFHMPAHGAMQTLAYRGVGTAQQPAIADLDGDGSEEVILSDADNFTSSFACIWKITQAGTASKSCATSPVTFDYAQISVEQLDGDPQPEIVALGTDVYWDPTIPAQLYAWHADGSRIEGFPVAVEDANPMRWEQSKRRFLVADFDRDGTRQIVVAAGLDESTFQLKKLGNDGLQRNWAAPVIQGRLAAMAAADLRHDGRLDVIVVAYENENAAVHVFRADGVEADGWPVYAGWPYPGNHIAVADLDGDSIDEIICAGMGLYIFRADGQAFGKSQPVSDLIFAGPLAVGDIDGDALQEIVTTRAIYRSAPDGPRAGFRLDFALWAIRPDGTVARTWKLNDANGSFMVTSAVPAIGDFDADGKTDIALSYFLPGSQCFGCGVASLLTTGAPYNAALNDWPFIYHDVRNTSVRQTGQPRQRGSDPRLPVLPRLPQWPPPERRH